jgi:hypothetical protein
MDIASLVTVLTQLGMAAAAWRLANALKVKVDDHEKRIGVLENVHIN